MAKSRSELPHLYYPKANTVRVINAHRGGGAWSPAVNGKMPVGAWVPSRDDSGNGTTTLTDLAGSNDGTLTNMGAATDWVADTDAGGVRALDFDGDNDHVLVSASLHSIYQSRTTAGWFKLRSVGSTDSQPALFHSNSMYLAIDGANSQPQFFSSGWRNAASAITTGSWFHIAWGASFSGATPTATKIWLNGSPIYTTPARSLGGGDSQFRIGARGDAISSPHSADGLFDDCRIWHELLDDTDIADLYASGNGRGVDAS